MFALSVLSTSAQTFTYTENFTNASFDTSNNNVWGTYSFVSIDNTNFYYVSCRNANPLYPINGNGILFRNSQSSYLDITFPNGLGDLYFEYKKGSGESIREKKIEILIVNSDDNIELLGETPGFGASSGLDPQVFSYNKLNINKTGVVKVRIKNVGSDGSLREFVVDNLKWNNFATASQNQNKINNLSIYPNPASSLINIKSDSNAVKEVFIYDVVGKLVLKTNTDLSVNIAPLHDGVYIIKVIQDNKTSSRKFIKR